MRLCCRVRAAISYGIQVPIAIQKKFTGTPRPPASVAEALNALVPRGSAFIETVTGLAAALGVMVMEWAWVAKAAG